jgi:hypothetical protein
VGFESVAVAYSPLAMIVQSLATTAGSVAKTS